MNTYGGPIRDVTGLQCQAWFDEVSKGICAGTARNRLAVLRTMFNAAYRLGVVPSNPANGVQVPELGDSTREELTDEEVEKLLAYLKSSGKTEWATVVYLGRYIGAALGDAVAMHRLSFHQVGNGLVAQYERGKTGAEATVPVPAVCESWIRQELADGSVKWLCPNLREKSISSLSHDFIGLLKKAGIDTGEETVNGRIKRKKGAHSLRHSFCSDLARRGVPADLRKLMAGHATDSAHAGYVHQDANDIAARMKPFLTKEVSA